MDRDRGVLGDLDPGGGELGAVLDVADRLVPDYLARLDALAATIVREVNLRHTTGIGRGGSFTSLVSTQAIGDSAALNDAGLPFALEAGGADRLAAASDEARADRDATDVVAQVRNLYAELGTFEKAEVLYARLREGVRERRDEFSDEIWSQRFVDYCRGLKE